MGNKIKSIRLNRILCFLLSLFLLLASMPAMFAFAEGEPVIAVGTVTGNRGSAVDVQVPVSISESSGIAGYKIVINYDSTKVEAKTITDGITAPTINLEQAAAGRIIMTWADTKALTSAGNLFTVSFSIKAGTPSGPVALDIQKTNDVSSFTDTQGNIKTAQMVNGAVNVYVPVTGITLDKTMLTLEKNEQSALITTVAPADATNQTVSFSSSNEAVASIDSTGNVTAKANGTANITATGADGATAACLVTVLVKVTGVSLDKTSLKLLKGEKYTLVPTVEPSDATNKKVTFSSDNTAVASVDVNSGEVTGVGNGTATITATTEDGSKTAACAVTVTVPVSGVKIKKDGNEISRLDIIRNENANITIQLDPADATDKTYTLVSANPAVATVDHDTGTVAAVGEGHTQLTATSTDGSKTAVCDVYVTVPPLVVTGISNNAYTNTNVTITGYSKSQPITVSDNGTPIGQAVTGTKSVTITTEGPHTVAVSNGKETKTIIFTIQKTAPTVQITLNPESTVIKNSRQGIIPTITFGGTCIDSSKSVLLNGQPYKVDASGIGSAIVQAGHYVLTASARDMAGNATSVAKTFDIIWDANAPVINITGAENGKIYESVQPVVALSDGGAANSNINEYTYTAVLTKPDGSADTYAKGQAIPLLNTNGRYRLYVQAVNPGYTDVVSTMTVEFIIDNDTPAASINGVEDGGIYKDTIVPVFEFSDEMTSDAYLFNNATIVLKKGTGEQTTVDYFPGDPITEDGTYTLTAKTSDEFGHNSPTATVSFTIDRTKPVITISHVVDKFTYKNTNVVLNAASNEGNLEVRKSDGTLLAADNGTLGQYTFTGTNGSIVNYKLILSAQDDAGNLTEKTLEFSIDRLPVNILITGIAEGQIANTSPFISFTTYNGTAELQGTTATIDSTPFTGGVYTVEGNHVCVVKNTVGETVYTKTVNFTIDRTAPSVTNVKVYKKDVLQASTIYIKAGDTLKVQATVTDRITDKTGVRDVAGKAFIKDVYFTFAGKTVSVPMTNTTGQVYEGTWVVDNTNDTNLDLLVYAKDIAQNSANITYANKVTIDNIKPVVSLSTNPVQADGRNGIFKSAAMSVTLSAGNDETIMYNFNGADGQPASGAKILSPNQGSNTIVYYAQDKAGNVSERKTFIFQYDSILPANVEISSSLTGLVNTSSVNISGKVQGEIAGNGTRVLVKRVIAGNDSKEIIADASINDQNGNFTISNLVLLEGTNTFELIAQDLAGNISAQPVTFTRTLDTVAPMVEITKAGNDTQYTAHVNEALASGFIPTAALNGSSSGVTVSEPVEGVYTITTPQLEAGNNTITFTAADAAGNSGTGTLTISYIPPATEQQNMQISNNTQMDIPASAFSSETNMTVRTTTVSGETSYKPLAAPLSFEFTGIGGQEAHPVQPLVIRMYIGSGLKGVTLIHIDGSTITETNAIEVTDSSSFDINAVENNAPKYPNDTPYYLADTGYLVFKTANFSAYQPAQDSTPPVITVSTTDYSITKADYDSNAVKLEGTITDQDQNVNIVEVTIDGAPVADVSAIRNIGVPSANGGTNTYTSNYSINLKSVLANGTHDVRIKAQDAALNITFTTKTFTVDITPPVLTATPQRTLTRDQAVIVNLNVTKNSVVSVKRNSEPDSNYVSFATFNGAGSISLQLTDGMANTFDIRAVDSIGNSDVKTVTITRDSTPPVITVTGVSDGDIKGAAVNITVTANEGLTPSVTLDGKAFSEGIYSDEGHHTLVASATDTAGNSTTKTIEFTIDTSVPVITVTGVTDGALYSDDQTVHITAQNADSISITQAADNGAAAPVLTVGLTNDIAISVPAGQQHSYTINVTATKNVDGQIRLASTTIHFSIDKKAPAVSMNNIADTQQDTISLTGTVDEVCDIYLDGVKKLTAQQPGNFSIINVPLNMNENTFAIRAQDAAGNFSTTPITVKRVSPPQDPGTTGGNTGGGNPGGFFPGAGTGEPVEDTDEILEPLPRTGSGELPAAEEPVTGKTIASAENEAIGSEGGTVETKDGLYELEIPQGTVNGKENTFRLVVFEVSPESPLVKEEQVSSGKIKMVSDVVDFGTTAPLLLKPVTATFHYDKAAVTSPENLRVYYWNVRIGAWVPVQAQSTRIDTANGKIEADLQHFTRYAVMEVKNQLKFSDVTNQWYATYVDRMALMGITAGSVENGTRLFKPDKSITRAEFFTFVAKALKFSPSGNYQHKFADDSSIPSWARTATLALYEKGIVTGYGDGSIGANKEITRVEMAIILVRAMGLKTGGKALTLSDRNSISAAEMPFVQTIVDKGIMSGKGDEKFHPRDPATRAEVSRVIISMLEALATL